MPAANETQAQKQIQVKKVNDPADLDGLLSAEDYQSLVGA